MNESRAENQAEVGVANAARDRTASPFQFSILGLLGLMTVVGVAMGLLFAVPIWIASLVSVVVNIALPAVLTTIVIYSQGYQRTFCVGAIFPSVVALIGAGLAFGIVWIDGPPNRGLVIQDDSAVAWRIANAIVWGMIPTCGLLAMSTRYLVEARQKP